MTIRHLLANHCPDARIHHRPASTRAIWQALCLCMLVMLLSGCNETLLEPLRDDATIVAFGDSLTEGKGVRRDEAYPAVLQTLIPPHTVINSGLSGETTAEGLQRLPDVLTKYNPDLLILLEGGNDILRNQDLAVTRRNLDQMIRLARARNTQVVLIGVPRRSLFASSAQLYGELAKEHDIAFQKSIVGNLLRKPGMKSDSVHFNAAGYAALAEAIATLLEEQGAL